MLMLYLEFSQKWAKTCEKIILLWYEGVKQRGVMLWEVFLLDGMLQTQQLTWDQWHLFQLPLPLKHQMGK